MPLASKVPVATVTQLVKGKARFVVPRMVNVPLVAPGYCPERTMPALVIEMEPIFGPEEATRMKPEERPLVSQAKPGPGVAGVMLENEPL